MIPIDRAHLFLSAGTHPGRKGKNNEDRYGVSAYQVGEQDLTPSLMAIIADGVGGHRAGEVAAEIAVEIVSHVVAESNAKDPERTLADGINQQPRFFRNGYYMCLCMDPGKSTIHYICW